MRCEGGLRSKPEEGEVATVAEPPKEEVDEEEDWRREGPPRLVGWRLCRCLSRYRVVSCVSGLLWFLSKGAQEVGQGPARQRECPGEGACCGVATPRDG